MTSKRASEFRAGSPAPKPQRKSTKWNVRAAQMRQDRPFVYSKPGRGQSGESAN
jgi:hypothetical protein